MFFFLEMKRPEIVQVNTSLGKMLLIPLDRHTVEMAALQVHVNGTPVKVMSAFLRKYGSGWEPLRGADGYQDKSMQLALERGSVKPEMVTVLAKECARTVETWAATQDGHLALMYAQNYSENFKLQTTLLALGKMMEDSAPAEQINAKVEEVVQLLLE